MQTHIILGIAVLVMVGYILMYNRIKRLFIKVEEGSSDIDVALEKRYDLLSGEIEVVKKFLEHEYDTYVAVTSVRTETDIKEETLEEKKRLSEESFKTIDRTIEAQQGKMEQMKDQLARQSSGAREKRAMKRNAYEAGTARQRMNINQKIDMLLSSIQQGLGGVGATIDALSEQYPVLYSYMSIDHFQKTIYDVEEHLQAARRLFNSNVSIYNQKIAMFPYSVVAMLHGMNQAEFYQIDDKKMEYSVSFD